MATALADGSPCANYRRHLSCATCCSLDCFSILGSPRFPSSSFGIRAILPGKHAGLVDLGVGTRISRRLEFAKPRHGMWGALPAGISGGYRWAILLGFLQRVFLGMRHLWRWANHSVNDDRGLAAISQNYKRNWLRIATNADQANCAPWQTSRQKQDRVILCASYLRLLA